MNLPRYKIVVLGQGEVGKTSISLKYVKNEFNDTLKRTTNASYLEKQVKLENEQMVKLSIWDTAGQEEFNSVAPIYYRDAIGALIVYDITSKESFQKAKKWTEELKENAPKGIILIIVGNKADLENNRRVSKQVAESYATANGASHFTVSAKNGLRVNEMFQHLAERVSATTAPKKFNSKKGGPKLVVEDDRKKPKEKKKCC